MGRKYKTEPHPCGQVTFCNKPTKADKRGVDGWYIDKLELKPFRDWPLKYKWQAFRRAVGRSIRVIFGGEG